MKKNRPSNAHGRIARREVFWGSQLDDQLLHNKDGSNRYGSLKQITRKKKKIWVAGDKVYERVSDANYWVEVAELQPGKDRERSSVPTVSGGAPGLGKKS